MDTEKNYKVIEVEEDELPALKEELENDWRRTFLIYSAINLKLRKGELKKTKLRLFKAEYSKYKSFTFMCPLFSEDHIQSITASWNPEEITDEEVGLLFSNVPAMNWNKPFVMIGNSYAMRNRFNDLFNTKKIITNTIPMTECHPASHAYLMIAKEEDLKIQKLTPEYELMPLPSSAANLIHSLWDFNYVESEEGVKERIETYEGMAALNLPSKNVVSWIQIYMCGALGMTFTLEEHRRKGLASAVTSQLAKQLAKELGTVFLFVIIDNLDSIALHKKIGFKTDGDVGFSLFIPSTAWTPSDGLENILNSVLSCK